jgi:putative two-component system response regulator
MSVFSTDVHGATNILVVDDTPENLRLLVKALRSAGHQVRAAPTGALALRMAHAETPDLILLDVDMPEMDGFEVFAELRKDEVLERVPTLFISAIHDFETKARALRAGGRDYVTKPFHMAEVLARVATHIGMYRLEQGMREGNERLQRLVADQTKEISEAQLAIIIALATLTDSRDDDSGQHVARIREMSRLIAEAARALPMTTATYGARFCELVGQASALHDVGKVGIPDAVLLKPGRLTPDEFEVMKTHAAIGARTLRTVLQTYPRNELLRIAAEIAACHHERWDGRGYPDGLAGEDIPVAARIVAVADVYDAMRSARPYKQAQPHDVAVKVIRDGAGAHFDPLFVAAFESVAAELDTYWCNNQTSWRT